MSKKSKKAEARERTARAFTALDAAKDRAALREAKSDGFARAGAAAAAINRRDRGEEPTREDLDAEIDKLESKLKELRDLRHIQILKRIGGAS